MQWSPRYVAILALSVGFGTNLRAQDEIPKAVAVPTADAKPAAANPPADAKPTSGVPSTPVENLKSSVRPLNVTADLSTGVSIGGTLTEVDVLLIKTAFGEASIPLSEIAGIRFPQGDDVTTSVAMLNGDSISGATDVKMVTIETDWGVAKVNGSSIRSLMFVPNLQWTASQGINGKRWTLQDTKGAPGTPGAPGQPGNQANRGNPTLPAQGNSGPTLPGSPSSTSQSLPGSGQFFPNPR